MGECLLLPCNVLSHGTHAWRMARDQHLQLLVPLPPLLVYPLHKHDAVLPHLHSPEQRAGALHGVSVEQKRFVPRASANGAQQVAATDAHKVHGRQGLLLRPFIKAGASVGGRGRRHRLLACAPTHLRRLKQVDRVRGGDGV